MKNDDPYVIIILVNYNGWTDTLECINSVLKSDYSNYRIIVIDNKSNDDSLLEFENWGIENGILNKSGNLLTLKKAALNNNWIINFLRNEKNNGFAGGNNLGVKLADELKVDYKYIWFLNNDTIIDKHALRFFVNRMEHELNQGKKLGILGGKLLLYSQRSVLQGIGGLYNKYKASCLPVGHLESDRGQYDSSEIYFDYPIGASLFVNKSFIDDVGPMCEEYFLYFEELDWIKRGEKRGWHFSYEPKVKVYHKEGGSTTSFNGLSKTADMMQVRNRILFTKRYYPFYLIFVIPLIFGSVINRLIRGQYGRAITIFWVIMKTLIKLPFQKK